MNSKRRFSENEILDSLSKSGYLFESEITKQMVEFGFFVESNVSYLDPVTDKSREIDLIAEFHHEYDEKRYENKALAKAHFVFEIKNNDTPLVLLTKYVWSPNSEIWESLKVGTTIPNNLTSDFTPTFYDFLFNQTKRDLYTQYCSFSKKKNEDLMAHHPEYLYSGLLKITYYCEESIKKWNNRVPGYKEDYFRNFLYLPIILINDELYELEIGEDNKNILKSVECSRLIFNYHYNQQPQTAIVHIVTKAGLKKLLVEILAAERKVEEHMVESIVQQKQEAKRSKKK